MNSPVRTAQLALDVIVRSDIETVFAAVVDWPAQGEWMLGTVVSAVDGDGQGLHAKLAAFTGIGRLGFLDTMVITRWEPPYRVDVLHTGNVVRGTGAMEVIALPGGNSRFVWSEDLELPLGVLGALGWPIAKYPFRYGVQRSLNRFAELVESGRLPRSR